MDLGVFLESPQGSQSSSRKRACTCAFLQSGSSSVTQSTRGSKHLWFSLVSFPRGFPTGLSHVHTWWGVSEEAADEILKFIAITGTNAEVIAALEGYVGRNETFDLGLTELKAVCENLGAFGVPEENFAVDLTIARGLDYYTGTVYETTLLDHPEIGSVCSGGRYDNLAGYYTTPSLPGVGISIGLTRLFYVLDEQGLLNDQVNTAPADALVIPMTADRTAAIAIAQSLRAQGIRAQVYGEQKKFKQKMSYYTVKK